MEQVFFGSAIVVMTKVRLRKPVKRNVPRPRIGTRLETAAQNKESKIIRIYEGAKNSNGRGGAKLIEAHGVLPAGGIYKDVPEDTVIIFLSQFGQCMSLMGQRRLANEYFRSDAGLRRFFKGEAGMAGLHHGEILSRTRFPGQKYPDVSLEFKDKNNPGFGWVWSLPIPHKRPDNFGHVPIGNQVINGNIHGGTMYLSELIERLGEGVYIVSSCLVAQNQVISNFSKIPYNLPKPYRARPAKRSRTAMAYAGNIFKKAPLRPGSFARRTAFPPKTGRVHKGPPKVRVAEVLARLGRGPHRVKLWEEFPRMRANVNRMRLSRVQRILQNPTNFVSKLSPANRNTWNKLSNINKGAFVNRLLNAPPRRPNPVYYFSRTHPHINRTNWFNQEGRRINKPANVRVLGNNWANNVWLAFNNVANRVPINMNEDPNLEFKWHAYVKNAA